jgi:hypothetical protein
VGRTGKGWIEGGRAGCNLESAKAKPSRITGRWVTQVRIR